MAKQRGKIDSKLFFGVFIVVVCIIGIVSILLLDTTGKKGSGLGTEFEYDLEQLGRIDPALIIYKESAEPISVGFSQSHSVKVDSEGLVYVTGDNSIKIFELSSNLVNEIVLTDSPLVLAVDSQTTTGENILFVGFKEHIELYDRSGTFIERWESPANDATITSIAVSVDDVFIADAGNRVVYRYDKAGQLINTIGRKDPERNIDGFVIPSPYFDLTIARDGLLRVVNPGIHQIETYTFNGDLESAWGEFSNSIEGFCGCCNPVNFAILPGTDISGAEDSYVTCEKGLTRVKIYNADGKFIGVVAGPQQLVEGGKVEICDSPEECQMGGFDVAVGPNGRIFVLDTIKNIVRIFSSI